MSAKINKKTMKAAALAAGLVAVLLPMGCGQATQGRTLEHAPGTPDTVVAPPVVD
jgi:hypothetical protein